MTPRAPFLVAVGIAPALYRDEPLLTFHPSPLPPENSAAMPCMESTFLKTLETCGSTWWATTNTSAGCPTTTARMGCSPSWGRLTRWCVGPFRDRCSVGRGSGLVGLPDRRCFIVEKYTPKPSPPPFSRARTRRLVLAFCLGIQQLGLGLVKLLHGRGCCARLYVPEQGADRRRSHAHSHAQHGRSLGSFPHRHPGQPTPVRGARIDQSVVLACVGVCWRVLRCVAVCCGVLL